MTTLHDTLVAAQDWIGEAVETLEAHVPDSPLVDTGSPLWSAINTALSQRDERIAALTAALAPFASAYGAWWQNAADDVSLTDDHSDLLTVGDVRRAAAVLGADD